MIKTLISAVAAALVAGGIGAAAIGLLTTLAEASAGIKTALNWYNPVGGVTHTVRITSDWPVSSP